MGVLILTLLPKKYFLKYLALAYAFYVGLAVSVSIHWFSDFVAGAILGSLVGCIVGKSFLKRLNKN